MGWEDKDCSDKGIKPSLPPIKLGDSSDKPVNHRAGYGADKLEKLLAYLSRNPGATLASGEGLMLADEIHKLRRMLNEPAQER